MRPEVGIVGSKLIYGDGTIQHAGVILGLGGIAGHAFIGLDAKEYGYMSRAYLSCDYTAVTAACLMCLKQCLMKLVDYVKNMPLHLMMLTCA